MYFLDVDAVLLTDIYQLLRAPPLGPGNQDQSQSLNCGFDILNRGCWARPARRSLAHGRAFSATHVRARES